MPACGVTPEAIPNAIASGRATNPTVTPAIRSNVKSCRVYPARKHKTDFGIHFLFSDVTVFLFLEGVMGKFLPLLCSEPVYAASWLILRRHEAVRHWQTVRS